MSARYDFGDRILVKELSLETGASRQPIMTALNRLSAEGFVRVMPQVGCQVISPTLDEIADFFLMFQRMEGLLAELAAKRRTDDQLLALRQVQNRLVAIGKTSDPAGHAQLNREFHRILHLMAHSPMLSDKQSRNFNMSDFFITHSAGFRAFMSNAVQEHEQMIGTVERHQSERARLVAEAHIAAVASAVISARSGR